MPVIAVGAAAPAMAASPGVVITFEGAGCKYPGRSVANKEYGYRLEFTVNSSEATTVTFESVVAPNYPDAQIIEVGPNPVDSTTTSIPEGESTVFVVIAADIQVSNGNSANGTATFTYTTGTGESGTVVGDITGFKPCK
ncbi:hypothetical protein [Phycicoccus flavus]|uniref:hypothetical protein n=1 Tax=Phycicoccus flavus TaxID=2502783 RepID=UPI000FF62F76|nr:hypothetical protein [Phycicoccus flavus]NHA67031.1 hypothetical protein [Phycicoccus flavus]